MALFYYPTSHRDLFRASLEETFGEVGPGIESVGAGFHLVAFLVPAQKAADAFDLLISNPPEKVNWEHVSIYCWGIQAIWEDLTPFPEVNSKFWASETAHDHWAVARGLVLQKMSPDALAQTLRKSQELESENRLKMYFFPARRWDTLPEKARQALISADREFQRPYGRRPGIFDDLRHATRAMLVDKLCEPYQTFLRSKNTQRRVADLGVLLAKDGPDLSHITNLWKSSDFQRFVNKRFRKTDAKFIMELEPKLWRLNKWANKASGPTSLK